MSITQIQTLCKKFNAAELAGDKNTLAQLLTDDFESIGPKGFIMTKSQWIERLDHFKYQTLDIDEQTQTIYDEMAIVRYRQTSNARYQMKDVAMKMRVMQVWVSLDETLQLAAIQFSPME